MEGDADTATVDVGGVAVGEAPHVVDAEDLEDVVETGAKLHIGGMGHALHVGIGGKGEQLGVERRVVAVGELAVKPAKGDDLA